MCQRAAFLKKKPKGRLRPLGLAIVFPLSIASLRRKDDVAPRLDSQAKGF